MRFVQKGGLRKRVCIPTLFVKNTKMVGHPLYLSPAAAPPSSRLPHHFAFCAKGWVTKTCVSPHPFRNEHENGGPSSLPIPLHHPRGCPTILRTVQKGGSKTCVYSHPFRRTRKWWAILFTYSSSRLPHHFAYCAKGWVTKTCVSPHPFRQEHENGGPSSLPIPPRLPHHFAFCAKGWVTKTCVSPHPFRQEHENDGASSLI